MKNLLQKTKQSLLLVTILITSTVLPLTTSFAVDAGNVNNTPAGSSLATVDNSTSVGSASDALQSSNNNTIANIALVTVSDAGNTADPATKLGAVSYSFQIGQYNVTADQYCAFLNAVASKSDSHGLYHIQMESDPQVACITRVMNAGGVFNYTVISGREKLPITYVSLNDAERFCNWLENGAPTPATDQVANNFQQALALSSNSTSTDDVTYIPSEQSTENGAYTFSIDANGNQVVEANTNASCHIPSQNEWVKAAYYKGNGTNTGYWMYPTQHDTAPNSGTGDVLNLANYETHTGRPPEADFLNHDLAITTVDCFSNTVSAYQACGMAGNVAEWTTDVTSSGLAVTRGGSWASEYSWYYNNDLMRTAMPKSYDPSVGTNFIGFRVVVAAGQSGDFGKLSTLLDTSSWSPAQRAAASSQFETSLSMLVIFSVYELAENCMKKMPVLEALSKFSLWRNAINAYGLYYSWQAGGDLAGSGAVTPSHHGKFMPKRFLKPALLGAFITLKQWGVTSGIEIAGNTLWFGKLAKLFGASPTSAAKARANDIANTSAINGAETGVSRATKGVAEKAVNTEAGGVAKKGVADLEGSVVDGAVLEESAEIAIEDGLEVAAATVGAFTGADETALAVDAVWTLGMWAEPYIGSVVKTLVGDDLKSGLISALDKYTWARFKVNFFVVGLSGATQGVKATGMPPVTYADDFNSDTY